jgi:AraC family ethanolamine operon transcriptional activator
MQLRFKDFDSYSVAAKGWGLDFVQLDRGTLDAKLTIVQSTRVLVINTILNRAFHQQGTAPLLGRTFGLYARPLDNAGVRWLDGQFAPDTLAVFPADGAYESYSAPGMDVLAITIDQSYLEQVSENTGLQRSIDLLPKIGGIFLCRAVEIDKLRDATFAILQNRQSQVIVRHALEFDLVFHLLNVLTEPSSEQRHSSLRNRDKAFAASIEHIHESSSDKLTIPDLSKSAGVSERTLRYAFFEKLGISPKVYLSAVRLSRVRSQLLQANGATTRIYEIASDQGFWHMGQFAADYRTLFGERPSDTLKRR